LIRAVLTSERIQAGIRHELPDMVAQIPDANPMKALLRAIENLDVYATAYRYPSPKGRVKNPPTPAEVDEYITKIELAPTEIAARFSIDLSRLEGPAGNAEPIRCFRSHVVTSISRSTTLVAHVELAGPNSRRMPEMRRIVIALLATVIRHRIFALTDTITACQQVVRRFIGLLNRRRFAYAGWKARSLTHAM
jgi:hypothetical protein